MLEMRDHNALSCFAYNKVEVTLVSVKDACLETVVHGEREFAIIHGGCQS